MNYTAIYPGSFCPPTYGHHQIALKAASIFPKLYIVCSHNKDKTESRWFSSEQCVAMWRAYNLPENVEVMTFDSAKSRFDTKQIIMIRGIRGEDDLDDEKRVLMLNHTQFNISNYFYIVSEPEYNHVSSSSVREAAKEYRLEELGSLVAPRVISNILERKLWLDNIFMVVGRPASGKSTILKRMVELYHDCAYINTDEEINKQIKPLLIKEFGQKDLVKVLMEDESKFLEKIKTPWMQMLKSLLLKYVGRGSLFVEVAYGLEENKRLYEYLGGKVIYFDIEAETSEERNKGRNTEKLQPFINKIPDFKASVEIAKKHGLSLTGFTTSNDAHRIDDDVHRLISQINKICSFKPRRV